MRPELIYTDDYDNRISVSVYEIGDAYTVWLKVGVALLEITEPYLDDVLGFLVNAKQIIKQSQGVFDVPDDDYIELGETDLVPVQHGWFINKRTGEKIDPQGRIYNRNGELIFEPTEIEEDPIDLLNIGDDVKDDV